VVIVFINSMSLISKLKYFGRSLKHIRQPKVCPYCHNTHFKVVARNAFVTELLKCDTCGLMHRHPKDDEEWLRKFYQTEYATENANMTNLPDDAEIAVMKKNNFSHLVDFNKYISALQQKPVSIIDYGCSWGYNVYKLNKDGYQTVGFELSVPRAKFGIEKLDVSIFSEPDKLPGNNDLFFSSHVIEHLGNIDEFVNLSRKLLKPDGIFMSFCPNGDLSYKKRDPANWPACWGSVHPNALDVEFAQYVFRNNPYLILTGDWKFNPADIAKWDGRSQVVGSGNDGSELLIVAKPNINN
jgi:2-polyprenyl-3-methyl-5-hydroxy-6-metoxy-1,4-benzoquinol methylase